MSASTLEAWGFFRFQALLRCIKKSFLGQGTLKGEPLVVTRLFIDTEGWWFENGNILFIFIKPEEQLFFIKKERNTSCFVLWPFKFVLTSVKFRMSGHCSKHSRNGIFHRLLDVCVYVCVYMCTWVFSFFVPLATLVIADSGDLTWQQDFLVILPLYFMSLRFVCLLSLGFFPSPGNV